MNVEIEARVYPVHVDLGDRVATVDLFGALGSRLVAAADARDDARKEEEDFSRQRRMFIERGIDAYARVGPFGEPVSEYVATFSGDPLELVYEPIRSPFETYEGKYDGLLGD